MLIAAAAAMFAACQQEDVVIDQSSNLEEAIGFSTYTPSMTRAGSESSENSGVTEKKDLEKYHPTFRVWGFKNILNAGTGTATYTSTPVFNADKDNALYSKSIATWGDSNDTPFTETNDWVYAPVRYWDRAAKDYDFHAASPDKDYASTPATIDWKWHQTVKGNHATPLTPSAADNGGDGYFTLAGVKLAGESLPLDISKKDADPKTVTSQTTTPNYDKFGKGTKKDVDLMIAEDVVNYNAYSSTAGTISTTSQRVNFSFIHILSRFNIGVKIGNDIAIKYAQLEDPEFGNCKVYENTTDTDLAGKKIYMDDAGDFYILSDAGGVLYTVGTDNHDIVATPVYDKSKPTEGVVTLKELSIVNVYMGGDFDESVAPVATGSIARWPVAKLTEQITATSKLGFPNTEVENEKGVKNAVMNLSADFTSTDEIEFTKDDYKLVFQGLMIPQAAAVETINLDGSNIASATAPYIKIVYTIDDETFTYYYNLATIFTASGSDPADLNFYEGWQNNLWITIDPKAILFDASVYKWATNGNVEVQIQ